VAALTQSTKEKTMKEANAIACLFFGLGRVHRAAGIRPTVIIDAIGGSLRIFWTLRAPCPEQPPSESRLASGGA